MGEMADMELDRLMWGVFDEPIEELRAPKPRNIQREAEKKIWTQRDGTRIHVKSMRSSHIRNTIRMINRNAPVLYKPWVVVLEKELTRRGESALWP